MQQQFTGLTMPVFTAFGWAGEETALNFALDQLEAFITELHGTIPGTLQSRLPFSGLNRESQTVFLSAKQTPEEDLYIAFFARPMSLEMQLAIIDQGALTRALKAVEGQAERFAELLRELEPGWTFQLKQMEVDEEQGTRTSYQDLIKEEVENLDGEALESIVSRAVFLNSEQQWVVPLMLSKRVPSEQIAAMGRGVISVMADELAPLSALLDMLLGKAKEKRAKKAKSRSKAASRLAEATQQEVAPDHQFIFETQLKPLHIRRGFINMTPHHWDFFAQSARATTRTVNVAFEDKVDKESAVWRLASNDMARLVLGDSARDWLEDTFAPDDRVQLVATRGDDDEIEIVLGPA